MHEIVLSDDLIEITAEINIWKHQAGLAVFEIGKRLKHVKENDLVHGQWEAWLQSVDINPRTARAMMQAYEQFGNRQTSTVLPTGKIFEMLSLPESVDRQEFISQEHVVPSTGETKTVDDMTVRQLREVTQQLKVVETERDKAKQDKYHFEKLWQQEKGKPAQVIAKPVEVVPSDYSDLKQQAAAAQKLSTDYVQLKRSTESMRQQYEEKISTQQKTDYAKKELQKYLSEHLRALTAQHDSAIFNYTALQGDREAYDIVMRFLNQYEAIVKKQFAEWEQLTSLRAVN